ncbi:hypothetical protein [Streptomyces murinus]|uniref:hypothetical protein n=1 Tax=Streptomyces murinus TaxID=33900 RepID=UPI001554B3C4
MHPVEAEPGEGLVQPPGGMLGLVKGGALHAAAGVAGGVDGVDGPLGAAGLPVLSAGPGTTDKSGWRPRGSHP